jgi:hypothetical protein
MQILPNFYTWEYTQPKEPLNGSWEQELFGTLYATCVKASNDIHTSIGKPMEYEKFDLYTNSAIVAILESMEQFELESEINYDNPVSKVGNLGRFNIYRSYSMSDIIVIRKDGKEVQVFVKGLENSSVA